MRYATLEGGTLKVNRSQEIKGAGKSNWTVLWCPHCDRSLQESWAEIQGCRCGAVFSETEPAGLVGPKGPTSQESPAQGVAESTVQAAKETKPHYSQDWLSRQHCIMVK